MSGTLRRLLERYGQTVELWPEGGEGQIVKAVLQPALERRGDLPTPLGVLRRGEYLYVGPPEGMLGGLGEGYLLCAGVKYEVQAACPVSVGDRVSHWWGVLRAREDEE